MLNQVLVGGQLLKRILRQDRCPIVFFIFHIELLIGTMACGPNIYHFPSAQIVLLESPLVSGPGRNGKPICLACYRLLHCYTSPSMRCSDDTILKEVGPSHQI